MSLAAEARPQIASRAVALPSIGVALAAAILVLCVPLFLSAPANLTSDESLYQAEAWNIAHGNGLTYPSGEPITHRAPFFPLVLAPAMKFAGPDGAYAVTKIVVAINALLVALIAWRCAGALASAIAGVAAASSAYLNEMGTTLYLDPFQCMFLLVAITALVEATRSYRARWFAVAGVSVGLAFLVKESALQFVPLGVVAWLAVPSLRTQSGARGAMAFLLAFGALVTPWFVWVYAQTGATYLAGELVPNPAVGILAVAAAIAAGSMAILGWPSLPERLRRRSERVAAPLAGGLVVVWGAAMLYALTAYSSWPYPNVYLDSIPAYLWRVAPQMQPYFLIVAAWAWVVWRALQGQSIARLICTAAALFLPFALFAANRNLQLRDALPLVYLSYVVLGIAAVDAVSALRRGIQQPGGDMLVHAGLALACGVFAVQQAIVFRDGNADAAAIDVRADSWDSTFVRESAAWLEDNLPAGSRVLTSRLYFSSLYVRTHGTFEVRQMPTVRVEVDAADPKLLRPASNLFRWGDHDLRPGRSTDTWLYLKRFPEKDYWVGLSQQELLEYIDRHEIDYVVLTGEDVAFSSLHHAWYFEASPAFTLLHERAADPANHLFVYRVDRTRMAVIPHSVAISPGDMDALRSGVRMSRRQIEEALGTPIYVTGFDGGLSPREQQAARDGIDLAAE